MNERWLFAVAPYAAALVVPVVCLWKAVRGIERRRVRATRRFVTAGGVLAPLLFAHGLLLFTPALVLRWNQRTPRLLALEAAGFCLGLAALVAVVVAAWRAVAASERAALASICDVVLLTLITFEITTGLLLAVLYRWGSSWAVVTLAPYAWSLLQLQPRVPLVATTPFLVRLHVFCPFAIVALAPFGTPGIVLAALLVRAFETLRPGAAAVGDAIAGFARSVARRTTEALSLTVEEES